MLKDLWYDLACARAIRHATRLPYFAEVLDGSGVRQARRLIADVYAKKGVVPAASLEVDGTMSEAVDPYYRHATYVGVRDRRDPSRLLMAVRLIHPTYDDGLDSLQLHLDQLTPVFQQKLLSMPLMQIAELAAYVKEPSLGQLESRIASMYLIRELVVVSQRQGVTTWVFGLRPELQRKYERLFGPALDRQGSQIQLGVFNALFIPYSIDIERAARRMLTVSRLRPGSKAIARFVAAAYADEATLLTHTIKPAH